MWQKHRCIFFYEEMGMTEWAITTAVTLGIGIISYFLKRTMNQSDKTVQKLQAVEQSAVTKEELKENRNCRRRSTGSGRTTRQKRPMKRILTSAGRILRISGPAISHGMILSGR